MTASPPRCEGTHDALRLAVGIMSSPTHIEQRIAVRGSWGRESQAVLVCFLVGAVVKRTPRSPWDKHRAAERAEPDGGPKGELMPNPHADALRQEHAQTGDVLVLPGSAEIHAGGTSGLKTLTWWRYVTAKMPNAEWVGKGDDDTFINLPRLFYRLPRAADVPMHSLFGTIKWGCYSDQRLKWEPSYKTWPCGRTAFARSQAPGEPANLSKTYEGPYELALGWFFAMPHGLAQLLASCKYAAWFHDRAVGATHEPFLRKEDDPLNGFWLCAACPPSSPLPANGACTWPHPLPAPLFGRYKCLREKGLPPVRPVTPPMREGEAHNMACISPRGLYRRPSNRSIAVHFLKTPSAMRYVQAVLRWERAGSPHHSRPCCARMVWPSERRVHEPEVCRELLSPEEAALEAKVDADVALKRGAGGRGRRGRKKRRAAATAA